MKKKKKIIITWRKYSRKACLTIRGILDMHKAVLPLWMCLLRWGVATSLGKLPVPVPLSSSLRCG